MFADSRDTYRAYVNALAVALILGSISLAALPFANVEFALPSAAFSGMYGVATALNLLTAFALFELYVIDGRGIFLGAASAYLLNTITVYVHGPQNWMLGHVLFAVLFFAGTVDCKTTHAQEGRASSLRRVLAFTSALGIAILSGLESIPFFQQPPPNALIDYAINGVALFVNVAAFVVVLSVSKAPAQIRIWLAVVLFTNTLDLLFHMIDPSPNSIPWYAQHVLMLATSGVFVFALLRMWSTLYATSVSLTRNLHATITARSKLQKRFDREHTIAAELQQASLPRTLPRFEELSLSAVYRPAERDLEIGGDWYDAFVLEDGQVVLTIGDVLGKGLAASLVMGKVRQMMRIAALTDPDPATMLDICDRALRSEHPDMVVTAFVAIFDRRTASLTWASAGHPPPCVRNRDGSIEILESLALPLGLREADPRSSLFLLKPGSMLVAYTDGLVESTYDILEGIRRVHETLRDDSVSDAESPAQLLFDRVVGRHVCDDTAIVTLKFSPVSADG